jgi:hypothetical protein
MGEMKLLENKGNVLLDVKRMITACPMQEDKIHIRIVCYNLIEFSFKNGLLLKSPYNNQGELYDEIIIYEDDLTENGKSIFWDLSIKWLTYTDNEAGKIDRKNNVKMLGKYYNQLMGQA